MGNGCHIGAVGLEDDTVEGYDSGEDFRQMAFLEGEDTTDAKDELRELQQFKGLVLVASETMEDTSWQLPLITSEKAHHLVLCLPTVYHQG